MIDNFTLLVTLAAIVFVVLRAVKLDNQRPWFQTTKPSTVTEQPTPSWRQRVSGR